MRSVARTLLPFALFLIIAGCAHVALYDPTEKHNPCPRGQSEVVCIDPSTLAATPDPVHVKSGHYVHFFLNGGPGHQLMVTPATNAPFDDVNHVDGHAWAHAKPGSSGSYPYSISLDGKKMDPTIMIDP